MTEMIRSLILLVALATFVSAHPTYSNCIDGCKCKGGSNNKLVIYECNTSLTLNGEAFKNLKKDIITVISIENVIINTIEHDAFHNLPVLHDVVIKKAGIGHVHPQAFESVKNVNFEGCGFEDVPTLSSRELEELHFGNCKLNEIPNLSDLQELVLLNLSYNYIKKIDYKSFANLVNIEEINLAHNEIKSFPGNVFVNNQELNTLYLDNNPLEHFSLNTSNELELLSLTSCKLTKFGQKSTRFLDNLAELKLNDNQISALQGIDMAWMKELNVIDLSNNKLTKLESDVFENNTKLEKIILDGNKFGFLPLFQATLDHRFKTYMFSCNNCGLTKVNPNVFDKMPFLTQLHLTNNHLFEIDESFSTLSGLSLLDLSYNNIKTIDPSAFSKNHNLDTIKLSGNKLRTLNPEIFKWNRVLTHLELKHCSLTKLWQNNNTFINSVRYLDLANNSLKSLTVEDLNVTPGVKVIDIKNNPFACNEHLRDMIVWLTKKSVYPVENEDKTKTHLNEYQDNHLEFGAFIEIKSTFKWKDLAESKCPDMDIVIDNELKDEDADVQDLVINEVIEADLDTTSESISDNILPYDKEEIDDDDDYYDYDDDTTTPKLPTMLESIDEAESIQLASYILSITSVFVFTALFVLFIAVTATLIILRRNGSVNMHRANLPRIKIPLWTTPVGEKKHSGSIYRPLSEDLSEVPKRYDFSATPHN